jgi:hypothetical protein
MNSEFNIAFSITISDDYKNSIIGFADEMAAAASERTAHSYDNLIRARKMLESKLDVALIATYDT